MQNATNAVFAVCNELSFMIWSFGKHDTRQTRLSPPAAIKRHFKCPDRAAAHSTVSVRDPRIITLYSVLAVIPPVTICFLVSDLSNQVPVATHQIAIEIAHCTHKPEYHFHFVGNAIKCLSNLGTIVEDGTLCFCTRDFRRRQRNPPEIWPIHSATILTSAFHTLGFNLNRTNLSTTACRERGHIDTLLELDGVNDVPSSQNAMLLVNPPYERPGTNRGQLSFNDVSDDHRKWTYVANQ